jgi:hypothetical protein
MHTPNKIVPLTRREIGAGLAFAEEYDLQRLSTWAAQGWRLAKISGMWMVLEQALPEQVVFAIDYQDKPDQEYFEMCAAAGWQQVLSIEAQIHLFKAAPGTKSIFGPADITTKYERAARMFARPALWSGAGVVATVVLFYSIVQPWLVLQDNQTMVWLIKGIALGVFFIVATIFIFTCLPWLAYRLRVAGIEFRLNRVTIGLLFGICGAVLGYFIGSMIP